MLRHFRAAGQQHLWEPAMAFDFRPRRVHVPTGYVSEFEQFIDRFKASHPEVEDEQQLGWSIWWDRDVDTVSWELGQKTVPVKPYSYE
jgi:hypothetical protein